MSRFKKHASLGALAGGLAVFGSGCTLGDVATILNILKLLGII